MIKRSLLVLALVACGRIESTEPTTRDPGSEPTPTVPPPSDVTPAPSTPPVPASPPASRGVTTAVRDGKPLYLGMCTTPADATGVLHVWGEVTDPAFEVDEAIIAFDVTPSSTRGQIPCVAKGEAGAHVLFAEARGAEFDADPAACSFTIVDTANGDLQGHISAEYSDGTKRHAFTVDFVAPRCSH
jgi:hypothetical protein